MEKDTITEDINRRLALLQVVHATRAAYLEALKVFARECNPEMTAEEIEAEICKMR